jgi:hypothetical protein
VAGSNGESLPPATTPMMTFELKAGTPGPAGPGGASVRGSTSTYMPVSAKGCLHLGREWNTHLSGSCLNLTF